VLAVVVKVAFALVAVVLLAVIVAVIADFGCHNRFCNYSCLSLTIYSVVIAVIGCWHGCHCSRWSLVQSSLRCCSHCAVVMWLLLRLLVQSFVVVIAAVGVVIGASLVWPLGNRGCGCCVAVGVLVGMAMGVLLVWPSVQLLLQSSCSCRCGQWCGCWCMVGAVVGAAVGASFGVVMLQLLVQSLVLLLLHFVGVAFGTAIVVSTFCGCPCCPFCVSACGH